MFVHHCTGHREAITRRRLLPHHPIVDTIFFGHMFYAAVRLRMRTPTSIRLFTLASLEPPSMNCMTW